MEYLSFDEAENKTFGTPRIWRWLISNRLEGQDSSSFAAAEGKAAFPILIDGPDAPADELHALGLTTFFTQPCHPDRL